MEEYAKIFLKGVGLILLFAIWYYLVLTPAPDVPINFSLDNSIDTNIYELSEISNIQQEFAFTERKVKPVDSIDDIKTGIGTDDILIRTINCNKFLKREYYRLGGEVVYEYNESRFNPYVFNQIKVANGELFFARDNFISILMCLILSAVILVLLFGKKERYC